MYRGYSEGGSTQSPPLAWLWWDQQLTPSQALPVSVSLSPRALGQSLLSFLSPLLCLLSNMLIQSWRGPLPHMVGKAGSPCGPVRRRDWHVSVEAPQATLGPSPEGRGLLFRPGPASSCPQTSLPAVPSGT